MPIRDSFSSIAHRAARRWLAVIAGAGMIAGPFAADAGAKTAGNDYLFSVLANADAVDIRIRNEADAGCWSAAGSAKSVIEARLRAAKVVIRTIESKAPVILMFRVAGSGAEGGMCAAYAEMYVVHWNKAVAPNGAPLPFAVIRSHDRSAIVAGRGPLNDEVARHASDWATEFAALWREARQRSR